MSTRNDVLAEFTRGTVTRYFDTDAMAEEIVRLRERVRELEVASAAAVTVTEAMVEAAAKCLRQRDEGTSWCTWDTLKWQTRELYMDEARAVLTAALTAASEGASA